MLLLLSLALTASAICLGLHLRQVKNQALLYFPSPPPDPIIGNLRLVLQIGVIPWLTFQKWGEIFGMYSDLLW